LVIFFGEFFACARSVSPAGLLSALVVLPPLLRVVSLGYSLQDRLDSAVAELREMGREDAASNTVRVESFFLASPGGTLEQNNPRGACDLRIASIV
jgi:hypothetical protein